MCTFPEADNFSRFVVVKLLNLTQPLASQSLFWIAKYLEGIIETPYKAKKQITGEVLVKVQDNQPDTKLLVETLQADLEIRVTPHRILNISLGVISEPDMLNETFADLLAGLKYQGVTAVRRITIRSDDK